MVKTYLQTIILIHSKERKKRNYFESDEINGRHLVNLPIPNWRIFNFFMKEYFSMKFVFFVREWRYFIQLFLMSRNRVGKRFLMTHQWISLDKSIQQTFCHFQFNIFYTNLFKSFYLDYFQEENIQINRLEKRHLLFFDLTNG